MAKQTINIAKITAPQAEEGMLHRERLFQKLDSARKKRIIWVAGPAGSGKTTLLSSYIRSRSLPCLWYQVDGGDNDLATFFYYLGLAAKKAAPRRRKTLPLLTAEYLMGIPEFSRNFFEELFNRLKPPAVLVFDNYQEVPRCRRKKALRRNKNSSGRDKRDTGFENNQIGRKQAMKTKPKVVQLFFTITFLLSSNIILAQAEPTVTLNILNVANQAGEIVIVRGNDVEVEFFVTDPAEELSKNDEIRLNRIADGIEVASKKRGESLIGTVSVPTTSENAVAELAVEYVHDGVAVTSAAQNVRVVDDPYLVNLTEQIATVQVVNQEVVERIVALETTDPVPGPPGPPVRRG